jgi:hypothetical protein
VIELCIICHSETYSDDRIVLVRGKIRRTYCSESCVRRGLRQQQKAARAMRLRGLLGLLLITIVLVGGHTLWNRYRLPKSEWISSPPPPALPEPPPPGPIYYGPAWPPTDAEWMMLFTSASWIYPLPGPVRRPATIDARVFSREPTHDHPAQCRVPGRCGVDVGGDIWGEHIYAVQDGVVDHVQTGTGNDDRGGQYVRLSHFGGMVFTQYFHLAAIPRTLTRGTHVRAGTVIGLLGDTGVKAGRRHLYFSFSIRPSATFSETFWDPKTLMTAWPLRVPPQGTVAGFAPHPKEKEPAHRRRSH